MSREASIFTIEVMTRVRAMLASGMTAKQIADSIGCDVDSLRSACHKRNISLRRHRAQPTGLIRLDLPSSITDELRLEARRRGVTYDELAAEIIDAVVGDSLYAAVLDK